MLHGKMKKQRRYVNNRKERENMELLEKETFYYKFNDRLIEPVECAFLQKKITRGTPAIKKPSWLTSRI